MATVRTLAAVALASAMLLVPAAAAHAEDPSPSPSVVATPAPSETTTPDPSATQPAATPAPAPTTVPPRTRLPLRVGDRGPMVALAQQRLQWLGFDVTARQLANRRFDEAMRAQVKAFQVKYWIYPSGVITATTWNRLESLAGTIGKLPKACTEVSRAVCADKRTKLIRLVVDGKVKLTTDARFGVMFAQTGEGVFRVFQKDYEHTSSLYGSSMPRAMFFNGNEAVHYSPFFDKYGYNGGSHGCIGIRDIETATWLFKRVPIGTRVVVYR